MRRARSLFVHERVVVFNNCVPTRVTLGALGLNNAVTQSLHEIPHRVRGVVIPLFQVSPLDKILV